MKKIKLKNVQPFILNQIVNGLTQRGKKRWRLKSPPTPKQPLQIERSYSKNLLSFVNKLENIIRSIVIPQLPDLTSQAYSDRPQGFVPKTDAWSDSFSALMLGIRNTFQELSGNDETMQFINEAMLTTNTFNYTQWQRTLELTLGVPIFQEEPWMNPTINSSINENVSLIQKLSIQTADDIEEVVQRSIRQGKSVKTIEKLILNGTDLQAGVFRKVKNRARLIARDQVGKLNGQLSELRQTNLGITHYIWKTSLDERVRTSHREKHNKRFAWNSPPADTGHPGQDYQCRCIAEPDFEDFLGGDFIDLEDIA